MQLPTRILPVPRPTAGQLLSPLTGLLLACGLPLALSGQGPASGPASASPTVQLDPLRVTSDLWASPLDRMPASVTVLDEAALRDSGASHLSDLIDRIPNLTSTGGTSRPRYFQIRGIGENSQYEGETPDSSVRFLVDDLDFTGLGSLAGTFDVSQVEVLRGPQAGAFGANAAGGVIRLVTQAPTPYWTGRIEATLGEDSLRAGGIALGGPLIAGSPEKLMMRFSVHQHQSDGFRRNVFLNRDTNARDELTARLRLTWNPSAAWQWQAAVLHSDLDNGFDEFALDNNGRLTFSDQPGRDEQASTAASLRGTFSGWEGLRLTTVTSGAWVDSLYSYDDDWTAASYQGFSELTRDRSVFNQELRLDSDPAGDAAGRWTLGMYFSDTDEQSRYTNEDPGNIRGLDTRYRARNLAGYGQIARELDARTRVILGLRAEHIDVDGTGTRTRFRKEPGTFDPPASFAPGFDDVLVGGKLTLEHDLSDRHLGFASITRGYKGGGVNVDARINPPTDPLTYDTEYLWNYEIGVRGHWFEQRLRGEITAFYLDRQDPQVRDSAGFGGSYRFFTDNAGSAEVYGLEASASYALNAAWLLHGSLGLMDSSLDSFVLDNGNTGGGRRLANTPPYSYSAGIRYQPESGLFGNLEITGQGRQYDSNNHDEARSAFNVVHGSLGYAWDNWSLVVWGRNLFDERYENRVFFFGNEDPDYIVTRYENPAPPRQFGVTANYQF